MAQSSTAPDLEVEIGVTLNKLIKQLAAAEARMNKTAMKMQRDFNSANAGVIRGFERANRSANTFARGGLRNLSMQFSQVLQQGATGGDYFRALAIQIPDMALGFGSLGIAIGAVAGSLLPLAENMLTAGHGADELKTAMKELTAAARDYDSAQKDAGVSFDDLAGKYGILAGKARQYLAVQRQLARADYVDALAAANEALAKSFGRLENLGDASKAPKWLQKVQEPFGNLNISTIETMAKKLGLSRDAAISLGHALAGVENAAGPGQAVDELEALRVKFEQATGGVANMTEEQRKFYHLILDQLGPALKAAAADTAAGLGDAADEAGRLKRNLTDAATLYQKARVGLGEIPPVALGHDKIGAPTKVSLPAIDMPANPVTTHRQAASSSTHKLTDAEKAYQAVISDTAGSMKRYLDMLDAVERAKAAGAITAEQAGQEQAMLNEKILESTDAGRYYAQTMQGLESSLSQAIATGKGLSGVLSDLAAKLAEAALQASLFGTGPLSGGGTVAQPNGGLLSGLMGSIGHAIGIPGFANGTNYAPGGLAMVGEKGPELVRLPRGSQVIPSRQAQTRIGGGDVTVRVEGGNLTLTDDGRIAAHVKVTAAQTTQAGLQHYDSQVLPFSFHRIAQNPDVIG